MIVKDVKYSYDDLEIVPARLSDIDSRSECNARYNDGMLPIFAAPMDSVVDDKNYETFKKCGINTIIHSNVELSKRLELTKKGEWCAYGIADFKTVFRDGLEVYVDAKKNGLSKVYALIDVANGHMENMLKLAKESKEIARSVYDINLVLMSGNIAHPKTYIDYCNAGINYVRVSAGTGSMCLTNSNVGVGYAIGSLIDEIYTIKHGIIREKNLNITADGDIHPRDYSDGYVDKDFVLTKIVADGGIRNYDDVNIALALGADYVMIGGLLARKFESCASFNSVNEQRDKTNGFFYGKNPEFSQFCFPKTQEIIDSYQAIADEYGLAELSYPRTDTSYIYPENIVTLNVPNDILENCEDLKKWLIKNADLYKSSHGMSTKEAQRGRLVARGLDVDEKKLKTSEGKTIIQKVDGTIAGWTENMESYLKSGMSYCNSRTLNDFKGKQTLIVKSPATIASLNK